jgi:hypothetical protein
MQDRFVEQPSRGGLLHPGRPVRPSKIQVTHVYHRENGE